MRFLRRLINAIRPGRAEAARRAARLAPGGVEQTKEQHRDPRSMVARLRSDMTAARASTEIATLARAASNGTRTAWVDDVQRTDVGNVKASLQALFAAAMLTLLIACANVAALIGARGADRAGEMAVRGALGATRSRIFGQLMTESLMLAVAGGVLGLLFGRWALSALVAVAPVSVPRLTEISLDGRIFGLGLAATLLTGLGVGLAPAFHLSSLFAGLALLLSMIGVYGLTASDVSARRRELAIRLALGASSREALWTVIRPCAAVLGVGTALGVVGPWGLGEGWRHYCTVWVLPTFQR